jgi:hypothetical protein
MHLHAYKVGSALDGIRSIRSSIARGGVLGPAFCVLAASLTAVVVGLGIGIQQMLPAALIAALVLYIPLLWIYFGSGQPRAGHFWLLAVLLVGLSLEQKLTGINLSFLTQLVLMALAPVAFLKLSMVWREVDGWRPFVLLLGLFLGLSIISSALGKSPKLPAAYQMMTNLKFVIMVLVGFTVTFSESTYRWFWRTVSWFWLPNALLVVWQWVSFSSYLSFFAGSTTGGPDPLGLLPSRAMGLFEHPTAFGAMMGFFAVCASARYATNGGLRNLVLVLVYALLIFLSGQRQELLGAILVFLMLFCVVRGWRKLVLVLLPIVLVGAVTTSVVWPRIEPRVIQEVENWEGSPYRPIDQPRQVLYSTATRLANSSFPLGIGLGTFGGAGSVKFNMDSYWGLGFGAYSWIERREYLMDTYWPNFIAETGWFGFAAMFSVILSLLRMAALNVKAVSEPSARLLALVGLGGVLFVFSLTPSSPAFQDPGTFLLPALFIGIAYNRQRVRALDRSRTYAVS